MHDREARTLGRVLFLSHDMLWPLKGGGRVRMGEIIERALPTVSIDLVVVAPETDVLRDSAAIEDWPGLTTHCFVDESPPSAGPARVSKPATELIHRLCERHGGYDVVHLEGGFLLPVVPPELHVRTVLAEHNVESELLRQRAAIGEPVSAADIDELRADEKRWWESVGAVLALCPDDAVEMRNRSPLVNPRTITNGWDNLPLATEVRADSGTLNNPVLLYFADYDYEPNRDGFHWLLTDVFPRIRERVRGAVLDVGGLHMSYDLVAQARNRPGVRVRGYLDDLAAELSAADIVLSPLRVSGGLHLKEIETIRRGCLLISTTAGGTGGIPDALRGAVCFADDAAGFAEHVARLCADPAERYRRRRHMIDNAGIAPTWDESTDRLMALWSAVANAAPPNSGREHRHAR